MNAHTRTREYCSLEGVVRCTVPCMTRCASKSSGKQCCVGTYDLDPRKAAWYNYLWWCCPVGKPLGLRSLSWKWKLCSLMQLSHCDVCRDCFGSFEQNILQLVATVQEKSLISFCRTNAFPAEVICYRITADHNWSAMLNEDEFTCDENKPNIVEIKNPLLLNNAWHHCLRRFIKWWRRILE